MKWKGNQAIYIMTAVFAAILVLGLTSCSTTIVKERELTSEGQTSYQSTSVNSHVISELRRVFDKTTITGNGIFENTNEGLARRTATNLAVADLAAQVQTRVKTESVIYNNQDVRDMVENQVHALVNNYQINSAGYDPGTNKYRVRVSISGETLVREINTRIEQ